MVIEIQLWQLVSLLTTFLAGMIGFGKYLLDKTEARIRETEKTLDEHTVKLAHAPSREDISKIYERVNASDARVNKLDGTFREHAITMRAMLNHFLNREVDK
jgi:hypothetical protein